MTATRDPRLMLFLAGGTLLMAVYGQWTATMAPYLSGSLPAGTEIFAVLVSVNGLVVLVGNVVAQRLIRKLAPLCALVIGCILSALSQFAFLSSATMSGYIVSMIIFTASEILVVPSEYLLIDRIATNEDRAVTLGLTPFPRWEVSLGQHLEA